MRLLAGIKKTAGLNLSHEAATKYIRVKCSMLRRLETDSRVVEVQDIIRVIDVVPSTG